MIKNTSYVPRPGYDRLWNWFGLSRSTFQVLPRVLMHEMPDEWQDKMAELLEQAQAEFPDAEDWTYQVRLKKDNKFFRGPDWLYNYRHPDRDFFDSIRRKTDG